MSARENLWYQVWSHCNTTEEMLAKECSNAHMNWNKVTGFIIQNYVFVYIIYDIQYLCFKENDLWWLNSFELVSAQ